jgi:hypothetical protein
MLTYNNMMCVSPGTYWALLSIDVKGSPAVSIKDSKELLYELDPIYTVWPSVTVY